MYCIEKRTYEHIRTFWRPAMTWRPEYSILPRHPPGLPTSNTLVMKRQKHSVICEKQKCLKSFIKIKALAKDLNAGVV